MTAESVGIDPSVVLQAAVDLRAATAWSGQYVDAYGGASPPNVRHSGAEAAIDRVVELLRGLPERCSAGLDVVADALVQGAADTVAADKVVEDPPGEER